MLKYVFSVAKHQEKATYGLRYKITLTRNNDEAILDKAAAIPDARIKIDRIHWYVLHYTTSIQQQGSLSRQIFGKTPTELRYTERSDFMKELINQNLWNFELVCEESMNDSIRVVIGFHQRQRQDSQHLNIDSFCRLPVTSAQYVIGMENYPDAGILLNDDDDDYSQGSAQIKGTFRASSIDDILQPFITDDGFRSSKAGVVEVGYNFYVFDIRYQQIFTASQKFKVEFKFDGVVPNDINGYALV